ncbi:hypothetical protein NDU88_006947 [Pleurodeles waltl]|uniref:Uncharacterized protein n=1 Tax=Pleurodeles waltl TaxID=8319 RepID=A0AAV7LWB8_PLEWA|nr:hypothetical protein NDU88_006947 [Pleurodeles waltl]
MDRCCAPTDHYLLRPVVCASWPPGLLLPCPLLWAAWLPSISVLQVRAGRELRVPQLSLRSLGARVRSGQSTSAGALLPSSTPCHQAMAPCPVGPRPGHTTKLWCLNRQSFPGPGVPSQRPAPSQQCCSPFVCPFKANSGQDQPNPRGNPCSAKVLGQVCLGRLSRRAQTAPPGASSSPIVAP